MPGRRLDFPSPPHTATNRNRTVHPTPTHQNTAAFRADWDAIAAVRAAVRVPVIANGDVRCLADAERLMSHTGADGVMSADPLLYYPALFDPALQDPLYVAPAAGDAAAGEAMAEEGEQEAMDASASGGEPEAASTSGAAEAGAPAVGDPARAAHLERLRLCREYAEAVASHPVPPRIVKGHVHKLLQGWLSEFTDLREKLNHGGCGSAAALLALLDELDARVAAAGRGRPVPRACERKQAVAEREAARRAAIEEQEREAAALAALGPERREQQENMGGGQQQQQQQHELEGGRSAKRPCVEQAEAAVSVVV